MVSGRTVILDCGASRTALGVFRGKNGRLCLEEFAHETAAFQTGGGTSWLERTRAALVVLRQRLGPRGPVTVVWPAHLTLMKTVRLPRAAPAGRKRVIRFEAEQIIPYALADVVWDSVVVAETKDEMEVLIAAARIDAIEPLCAAIQETGFEVREVLPSPLALLAGFRLLQTPNAGCSLVLTGEGRWYTLLQVGPKELAVRIFSVGGSDATEPTPAGEVEARPAGPSPVSGARLAQEVERSLRYFRTQGKAGIPDRLWLERNLAGHALLGDALAARLKVDAETIEARKAIDYTSVEVRQSAELAGALTGLIGAAAAPLRAGQPGLNLLPPARLTSAILRRRQPWLVGAATIFLASLLPPGLHFQRLAAEAQRKAAVLERRMAPLHASERRIQQDLHRLSEQNRQLLQLETLSRRRSSWLGLLAGLQERLTGIEDVWLEKLQVLPVSAGQPLKLAISGCLLDKAHPLAKASPESFTRVKELLASLAGSPFVAAVEAERFDNRQPGILKFDCVLVTRPEESL